MRKFLATFAAFIVLAAAYPALASETVLAGLSRNHVSINATFIGSELQIFGAVKRDAPAPDGDGPLAVVVVVEGPSHPITVRRMDRRMGIWVNVDSVEVDSAPSFYAIATSVPFSVAISAEEDLRHHISIPQSIRLVGESNASRDIAEFADAVVRIRSDEGLYSMHEESVNVQQETLFNTAVTLPSNLTEGDYTARVYLARGGKVVATQTTSLEVRKVGIERFLFNLAHEQALVYGILSLFIAVLAGWGASAIFRVLLRN